VINPVRDNIQLLSAAIEFGKHPFAALGNDHVMDACMGLCKDIPGKTIQMLRAMTGLHKKASMPGRSDIPCVSESTTPLLRGRDQ
jgi:hypothetical protein